MRLEVSAPIVNNYQKRLLISTLNHNFDALESVTTERPFLNLADRAKNEIVAYCQGAMDAITALEGGKVPKRNGQHPRGAKRRSPPPLWLKQLQPSAHWHRHRNGGGWVANTATVADTAYVARDAVVMKRAFVCDSARVSGNVRVTDRAIVRGQAKVQGRAIVKDDAEVTDKVLVTGRAQVGGHIRLVGDMAIGGQMILDDEHEPPAAKPTDSPPGDLLPPELKTAAREAS